MNTLSLPPPSRVRKVLLISSLCFLYLCAQAQRGSLKDSSMAVSLIGSSYAFQLPGADMARRFGFDSDIRLSYFFKSKKNWLFGCDISYMFGNRINERGILDSIKTSDGHVIASTGEYAEVRMFERGITASVKAGKLFSFWAPNPNSGFFALGSAGFLQHKIRIDVVENNAPQLTKEMKKGYDRLTNGFATSEFIGYLFLGNNRLVNFYGGFEFIQGFTQGRRPWLYDLMQPGTDKRLDLLYGIRVGWILPLYKRTTDEMIYY